MVILDRFLAIVLTNISNYVLTEALPANAKINVLDEIYLFQLCDQIEVL